MRLASHVLLEKVRPGVFLFHFLFFYFLTDSDPEKGLLYLFVDGMGGVCSMDFSFVLVLLLVYVRKVGINSIEILGYTS